MHVCTLDVLAYIASPNAMFLCHEIDPPKDGRPSQDHHHFILLYCFPKWRYSDNLEAGQGHHKIQERCQQEHEGCSECFSGSVLHPGLELLDIGHRHV
ncbi:hypothetical protein PVAP13_6KG166842 [Panicum virgatum]|uniref:Uncharacterized protein n=1 Tax=Panicum virgatum TaxID=38727 RepID=A0A8T0RDK5_PANVG|nr:hypothetical protein PVAP13_6KG166842 [Panicum virgatum]